MSDATGPGEHNMVDTYLACMAAHDWEGLAATVADEGLVRDGPFCDAIEGKGPYVEFLEGIITSLEDYELKVSRVAHVSDHVSYVELSETFLVDGVSTEYPECLVFGRDRDGFVDYVSVFMKYPGAQAPVEGGSAA